MALNATQEAMLAALDEGGLLPLQEALEKAGLTLSTYHYHRYHYKEFKEAVDALRARQRAARRVAKGSIRVEVLDASERSARAEEPAAEEETPPAPLDPRLEEWLEVFEATEKQVEALDVMRDRGAPVDYAEIEAAMAHPLFRRRFMAVEKRITLRALDTLRGAAGKNHQAALKILAAEMPEKFGNRVKVEHQHTHELVDGDEKGMGQLDAWLGRHLGKTRGQLSAADVIEGEVL